MVRCGAGGLHAQHWVQILQKYSVVAYLVSHTKKGFELQLRPCPVDSWLAKDPHSNIVCNEMDMTAQSLDLRACPILCHSKAGRDTKEFDTLPAIFLFTLVPIGLFAFSMMKPGQNMLHFQCGQYSFR